MDRECGKHSELFEELEFILQTYIIIFPLQRWSRHQSTSDASSTRNVCCAHQGVSETGRVSSTTLDVFHLSSLARVSPSNSCPWCSSPSPTCHVDGTSTRKCQLTTTPRLVLVTRQVTCQHRTVPRRWQWTLYVDTGQCVSLSSLVRCIYRYNFVTNVCIFFTVFVNISNWLHQHKMHCTMPSSECILPLNQTHQQNMLLFTNITRNLCEKDLCSKSSPILNKRMTKNTCK